MGRSPCNEDTKGLKKGPWTPEEDEKLVSYINQHGGGSWRVLPRAAGLNRCGKSCRLRWINYLRTDIRRSRFTVEEEETIIKLHSLLGNKWSKIAAHLPGRTDNEIKNHWNTHLKKKLLQMGIDPVTHLPRTDLNVLANLSQLLTTTQTLGAMMMNPHSNALGLQSNFAELAKLQVLQNMFQILNTTSNDSSSLPKMDQIMASNSGLNNITNNNVMYSSSSQELLSSQPPNYTGPNQLIMVDNNSSELLHPNLLDDNCSNKAGLSSNTTHETLDENDNKLMTSLIDVSSNHQNESNTNSLTTESSSSLIPSTGDHDLLMEGWEKLLDVADSDFWKEFINY